MQRASGKVQGLHEARASAREQCRAPRLLFAGRGTNVASGTIYGAGSGAVQQEVWC